MAARAPSALVERRTEFNMHHVLRKRERDAERMRLGKDYCDHKLAQLGHYRSTHEPRHVLLQDIRPKQLSRVSGYIEGNAFSCGQEFPNTAGKFRAAVLQANAGAWTCPRRTLTHNAVGKPRTKCIALCESGAQCARTSPTCYATDSRYAYEHTLIKEPPFPCLLTKRPPRCDT